MKPACIVLALVAILILGIGQAQAQGDSEKHYATQVQCGEKAQELIAASKMKEAEKFLREGVRRYPQSDWLLSLHGRVLYRLGKLDEAEDQFQRALKINPENLVARMLIKEVRLDKDALKDREWAEYEYLGMDKAGDLAVVAIGVWIGLIMSSMSGAVASYMRRTQFEKAMRRKDWDLVTDILETLIFRWEKAELRKKMEYMAQKLEKDEIERIIKVYVDDQDMENRLLFFFHKLKAKRDLSQA